LPRRRRASPFFYYDIPDWTGVRIPIEDVIALSLEQVPTFSGVKFTSDDMVGLQRSFDIPGDHQMLFGRDEQLLAGLVMGCRAAVGSTYNYAASIYHEVIGALARGDLARARQAQRRSADLVRVLERFGGLRAGKAIMAMLGVDCGPVRSPLKPLTVAETNDLARHLAQFDFITREPDDTGTADASA
jgi:N-acetylneuraminate lyase